MMRGLDAAVTNGVLKQRNIKKLLRKCKLMTRDILQKTIKEINLKITQKTIKNILTSPLSPCLDRIIFNLSSTAKCTNTLTTQQ